MMNDVLGHIRRSSSKLGSVPSMSKMDKNLEHQKMQTAKTITAKAELGLEEKMSAPRLDSFPMNTADA